MQLRPVHTIIFVIASAVVCPAALYAQAELTECQRVAAPYHASNLNNDPNLSRSDVDGNTFVVGATKMSLGSGSSALSAVGAAYVYTRPGNGGTHTLQAELRPSDPTENLFFGIGVSLDGDTAAIGAIGAVYVFERSGSTWRQTARIARSPLSRAFELDGDLLAIGEWDTTVGGKSFAGEVVVYRRQGTSWRLETRLRDPHPDAGDALGKHVDLSDGRVVAYSSNQVNGFSDPNAFMFVRTAPGSWRLEAEIQPDYGAGTLPHYFRLSSIDLCGPTLLIQGGSKAAIFELGTNGWRQVQVIDKHVWGFGSNDYYQDLKEDRFVVSSSRRRHDPTGHVSLVFRRVGGTWVKQAVLAQAADGHGLAEPQIDGDTVVTTRPDALSPCCIGSTPNCGLGAIYVYDLDDVGTNYGAGCGGATFANWGVKAVPDLSMLGRAEAGGTLHMAVENAAPGSVAFFVIGARPTFLSLGGDCVLHVGRIYGVVGPIAVSGGPSTGVGSGGGYFSVQLPPNAGPGSFLVQGLVVDPASTNGMFTVSRGSLVTLR